MPEKSISAAPPVKDERSDVYTTLARIRLLLDDALNGDRPNRAACLEAASMLRALKVAVDAGQSDYERRLVDSEIATARARVLDMFGTSAWEPGLL